jgi:hypothetical protein
LIRTFLSYIPEKFSNNPPPLPPIPIEANTTRSFAPIIFAYDYAENNDEPTAIPAALIVLFLIKSLLFPMIIIYRFSVT